MKICFITSNLTGGGAERVIANLSNKMVELGHEVTILLTASKEIEYEFDKRVRITQIGERTGHSIRGRVKRIKMLRNYYKQHKDTHFISMPTDTNLFAVLASIGLKVNLTVSERSNPNEYPHRKLRNFIYCFAKRFVLQTNDAKKCFSNRIQKLGCVIPNPVSGKYPEPFVGDRKKRIVAVGRLNYAKNHKMLIEAFSCISKNYPDYELWIYGKGTLQEDLQKLCEEKEINNKVFFPGFSDRIKEEIYDASMYVLPSDFEGISNSLLEAMALGVPVISTDCPIGGSKMLIKSGVNGLLTPVGDTRAFANAMKQYLENPELANKMGREASKVKQDYQIDVIVEKWLQYI